MTAPYGYELRYVLRGRKSHYVNVGDGHTAAMCGVRVWDCWQWYGSGSQLEIEKAEAMPLCRACATRSVPPKEKAA